MAGSLEDLRLPVELRQRLDFLLAAHELTAVYRFNRLLDDSRAETSAEHSWHLALAALVLAPQVAPDVDIPAVMAMLLVHDLPEVEVGDVPIHDEAARAAIAAEEHRAAARLFARLPAPQDRQLLAIWEEFETGDSDEARFARAVDRLQPLLLHWAGEGTAWGRRRVTVEQERRLMAVIERHWPPLASLVTTLIDDAHRRGMLTAAEPAEPGTNATGI